MPLYEYKCDYCGALATILRKVNERDLPVSCEKCQGSPKRRISVFAFPKNDTTGNSSANSEKQNPQSPNHHKPGIYINGATIKNCRVGVSLCKGANVQMQGVTFDNVEKPIELKE